MVSLLNNRYKPEKILGHGGMGKVYLMTDTHIQQRVAVKECFVSQNTTERIKREYYFMTKIEHKHLVKGLDFFHHKDRYFIVMEYVEGMTLNELLRDHPHSISMEKQLRIAAQICDAVAALNENGIIHRDIKPENIILCSPNLTPKLLDFGIAKAVNGELATITKTSNIIGTPAYMTPEQIDSRIEMCGNLDVFSLGIVFYQFLAWMPQSPFHGGQIVSTLDRIVNSELPPLFSKTKDPQKKYISQVIAWALRKNPQERIESVEMLQHLLCHQDEQKIREAINTVKQTSRIQCSMKKTQTDSVFACIRIIFWLALSILLVVVCGRSSPQTQPTQPMQLIARSSSDYTLEMLPFIAQNKHLWSKYESGVFLYKMREKFPNYRFEAIKTWRKRVQNAKNSNDVVKSSYQLLYVAMQDVITSTSWNKRYIEKLQQDCTANIQKLQSIVEKSFRYTKMLHNCLGFRDILQAILDLQKAQFKNSVQRRVFFDSKKLYGGYQNLFLALQVTERLSNQMKLLHEALRIIPEEELVYIQLLKIYRQAEFYEEAKVIYDHLQRINPHLLSADIEMLSIFLAQGEVDKTKKIFDKLIENEVFKSKEVQLLYCQYLFLIDDYKAAHVVLNKLSESQLSAKESHVRAIIKSAIVGQPRGNENTLLQAAQLYIVKGDVALAKEYIDYVDESIKTREVSTRIKASLYRVKLQLYDYELRCKRTTFSFPEFDITAWDNVGGIREQFISLLCMTRFSIQHGFHLDKYKLLLEQRCDAGTFFRIYGEYCVRQKKYLDAIGYWENAIQLQPLFRDYLTKKQYIAWQLNNGE